jgi:predicted dehydrogenase
MRYTVGLIGLGYWGPKLLRSFAGHDGFDLRWVCDHHEDRRGQALALVPAARGTAWVEDLFDDPAIDIVVIANQASQHFELARRALASGKHVFVEKPFTLASAEAGALCRLAKAQDRRIFVDHTYLFSAGYRHLRALVRAGTYGRIRRIHAQRCDFGRFQQDANVVWHLMYHDAYLLTDLLAAAPVAIAGKASGIVVPGVSDGASIVLSYADGVQASILCDLYFPQKKRDFLVQCEGGMLLWDDTRPEPLQVFDRFAAFDRTRPEVQYGGTGRASVVPVPPGETLPAIVDACYQDLCRPAPSGCDGAAALEVVRLVERLDACCQAAPQ